MEIEKLAERLVGLQFESGHFFENGTSFYETLSKESAEGLLRALHTQGYVLSRQDVSSPSITPHYGEHDNVHQSTAEAALSVALVIFVVRK